MGPAYFGPIGDERPEQFTIVGLCQPYGVVEHTAARVAAMALVQERVMLAD